MLKGTRRGACCHRLGHGWALARHRWGQTPLGVGPHQSMGLVSAKEDGAHQWVVFLPPQGMEPEWSCWLWLYLLLGVGPVVVTWDRIKSGDKTLGFHTNCCGWGVMKTRPFVDESTPLRYWGRSLLHIKEATSEIFWYLGKAWNLHIFHLTSRKGIWPQVSQAPSDATALSSCRCAHLTGI